MEVRSLNFKESKEVAKLHYEAFRGFFLSSLGKRFLEVFYRSIIQNRNSVSVGIFENDELLAFAIGAKHKAGFYTSILKDNLLSLTWSALPSFILAPSKFFHLLKSLKTSGKFSEEILKGGTLLSICVQPNASRSGLGSIVLENFEVLAFKECSLISLTTDHNENDYVNNFYQRNGYELYDVFLQERRKMNIYYKKKSNENTILSPICK